MLGIEHEKAVFSSRRHHNPIGTDRDPNLQANSAAKSKACFRFEWGPTSVLIYILEVGGIRVLIVEDEF